MEDEQLEEMIESGNPQVFTQGVCIISFYLVFFYMCYVTSPRFISIFYEKKSFHSNRNANFDQVILRRTCSKFAFSVTMKQYSFI